jgi:N-acetylmuramoyl-L-alanine amidase
VLLDAGHPPQGATGPTGLREADANLAIARELGRQLEAEGAIVSHTRVDDRPLDLASRVALAERSGAEVLVSIHNNALPDGVNPLANSGTSVFYNHAPSLGLARAVQAALVESLGARDLGVARGDLAMVRPTWLPAVLTEGLFLIVPEQEAALRDPIGQARYARGVATGLRRWLATRAR